MKFQLLSDFHGEFYYGNPLAILKRLEFAPNLDFLLLPGDIIVPSSQGLAECAQVLNFLSEKAKHVLFTMGNHEYYNSNKNDTERGIKIILPNNFHWLNNSEITLEGQHFFGGTLWFKDEAFNQLFERELSDFKLIKNIRSWVYEENSNFRVKANEMITEEDIDLVNQ